MGKYSYKPQTLTADKKFHTTFEPMRSKHIQLYTQDLMLAKKHLDMLQKQQQTAAEVSKGRIAGSSSNEAVTKPFDMQAHAEKTSVQSKQAQFHRRRALHHMEMAHRLTNESFDANSPGKSDSKPGDCMAPSLFDNKAEGHNFQDAVEYHTNLHSEALQLADQSIMEMRKMPPLPEEATAQDTQAYHEARKTLEAVHDSMMDLANMHREMVEDYQELVLQKADQTLGRDIAPGYDPEFGTDMKPSNNQPYMGPEL